MNDKQMKQIREQLPEGTKILRSYFEDGTQVIVKLPDSTSETRYTVKWDQENDYPRIELTP